MKKIFLLSITFFLFFSFPLFAQNKIIKVACIGNSVTYGYGLKDPLTQSYPVQLQKMLGENYEVKNCGHSGATLLRKGHNPYFKTREFRSGFSTILNVNIKNLAPVAPKTEPLVFIT